MHPLEKRVAALESKDTRPYRWCWRNVGESDTDAQARAGIVAGDNVIIFSWADHHANT